MLTINKKRAERLMIDFFKDSLRITFKKNYLKINH